MIYKQLDHVILPCDTKMNYYNSLDLSKYGTSGVCPQQLYNSKTILPPTIKESVIKKNPCKLNEGLHTENINYRNKKYSCYSLDKKHSGYGYYDLPCLKTAYRNKDYYNLKRKVIQISFIMSVIALVAYLYKK